MEILDSRSQYIQYKMIRKHNNGRNWYELRVKGGRRKGSGDKRDWIGGWDVRQRREGLENKEILYSRSQYIQPAYP